MTFDISNRWAKWWILSNSNLPVAKRRQQRGSMVIRAGIVDQTITGPLNVNGFKLYSFSYCDFMDNIYFTWYKI